VYRVAIFISHSWKYSHHYDTLSSWIFSGSWNVGGISLEFSDTSVPKDNPIHNAPNSGALESAIYERIRQSQVVIIPTGMYANYSTWIKKEIAGCSYHQKPILAVNPWGQKKSSSVVSMAAAETVGWAKNSVVNGVWRLSR
jgi:hypothetical protein